MKSNSSYLLKIALGACLVMPIAIQGLADEPADAPDISTWTCNLCTVTGGWFGDWDIGLVFPTDTTQKFADYRGLDDDGGYLDLGGTASYRNDEGKYFDLYARDLGLDTRALGMRGGKQGKYEFRANYSEVPRHPGLGTRTPFVGVGTDTLELAPFWTFEASDLPGLEQSLLPVTLESKRKTLGAGFTLKFGNSWTYEADFERQTRDGTRAFSGGLFFINAAIFPAPVDYTTDRFNMGLQFSGDRGQFRFEFAGSDFDNANRGVTWENPLPLGFGDEVSRSALEPDNEYHQFSLAGAFRFSPRFRISGKASVGEAEQNELFLPYSINPAHGELVLPRNSLDGKIDTSMFNLSARLYARLADGLDLTAQYKINERDNLTPVDTYTPVLNEVFRFGPRTNRPYSYERSQARLELRFRPKSFLRFNVGAKQDTLERTYQEVTETDEDSVWGEVRYIPAAWVNLRLKLDNLDRGAAPYMQLDDNGRAENPLMRKFNLAERDRERMTVELDLTPTDRLGINLSYYETDDDYNASVLGLTASEENSVSLDLNYLLGGKVNFYAFLTEDTIESRMSAADGEGALPWNAFTDDTIQTWGVGFSGQANEKVSYGLDFVNSESDGDILTDSGAGEQPFPVLQTELRNIRVYVHYKVSDRWGWSLDAYREEYASSDWLVDGIAPGGIEGVLTMGETSPDYETSVVRLFATFRF